MVHVYPDQMCLETLEKLIENDVRFCLFTNDITPDEDTVIGDLTLDPAADFLVAAEDFAIHSISGHIASVVAGAIMLPNDNAEETSYYGVVAVDESDHSRMLQVTRFDDAPRVLAIGESTPWLPLLAARWVH